MNRIICVVLMLSLCLPTYASPTRAASPKLTPTIGTATQHDTSQPLADSSRPTPQQRPNYAPLNISKVLPNKSPDAKTIADLKAQGDDVYNSYFAPQQDTVLQTDLPLPIMPQALTSFDGVNNVNNVAPPDTSGEIGDDPATGRKYYMQWVNLSYAIWDVTNPTSAVQVLAPRNGNQLWQGFGGACETNNDGDPIVVFDQFAKRWVVSQFATPRPYYQCFAVSATANPLGAWHRYAFLMSNDKFNDYAKISVWGESYFASINQFVGNSWAGAASVAFERDAMLRGLPARFVLFDLEPISRSFGGMLPADIDGDTNAPSSLPNWFAEIDDNASTPDLGPTDALRLWQFNINWANPTAATFGNFGQPNTTLPVAPINYLPCALSAARNCLPLPGNSVDAVGDRLMFRAAYRDFGTHQSLVLNHTVNASPANSPPRAGIRWYELRGINNTPFIYQQGTFAPNDNLNRWMASIAMDRVGNIALGYSAGNAVSNPSIRYTGRFVGDPLGSMTQGETVLQTSNGSQATSQRWGDYSQLVTDPTDDCTLWYTNQYYATTSGNGWRTRIGAFKFPNCGTAPPGFVDGSVRDAFSTTPIPDARVVATSNTRATTLFANTNADGAFTLPPAPDAYLFSATHYGYLPSTAGPFNITANATTTVALFLALAPTHVISGFVTDSFTTHPLSATIAIESAPDAAPMSQVFTDPGTGFYSVTLAQGQSYTLTASALMHITQARAIGNINQSQQENFGLGQTNGLAALIGKIQDAYTNEPIANALISVGTSSTQTNPNGAYALANLAVPNSYTLTISASGYSTTLLSNLFVDEGDVLVVSAQLSRPALRITPNAVSKTLVMGSTESDVAGLQLDSFGNSPISFTVKELTSDANANGGGGPDAYGYTWRSSQNGGATYNWLEASNGVALTLTDDSEANVALPFIFPFYGNVFSTARVGNNGALLLGASTGEIASANIPIASAPLNFIAPFWDDLDDDGGNVYTKILGSAPNRQFVVQWQDRPHYANVGAASVQAVLFEDGDILFQYKDVDFGAPIYDNGKAATVGIHGADFANFLQYSFNEDKLTNGQAICFDHPQSATECGANNNNITWLNVSPVSGAINPTISQNLQFEWAGNTAATPQPGNYFGNLVIRSNDPRNEINTVPITLTVAPSPTQGLLMGVVQGLGVCNLNAAPLAGAAVQIEQNGNTFTTTTRANGSYQYWLEQGNYNVTVSANGHISQTFVVVVSGQQTTTQNASAQLQAACIQVTPNNISLTLQLFQSSTVPLQISNTGTAPLAAHIIELPFGATFIGPDQVGYIALNNINQPFLDISTSGTYQNPPDDGAFVVTTTFPISYYGVSSNTLLVSNNGVIAFGAHAGSPVGSNSPLTSSQNHLIAPFWDDLSSETGGIYTKELGIAPNRVLVVQWQNRPRYRSTGTVTFQAQLRETGSIIFAYADTEFGNTFFDNAANATVGIRGTTSQQVLQVGYNTASIRNNSAVCFAPISKIQLGANGCGDVAWLGISPNVMTSPQNTLAMLDAAKIGYGTHYATLITLDAWGQNTVQTPITFTVTLPPNGRVYYFPVFNAGLP